MTAIFALAVKDLRTLFRVKSGLFFAFAWPLIMAVLFGTIFSGPSSDGGRRLAIALADDDQTEASKDLAARIAAGDDFTVRRASRAEAIDLVRKGKQAAAVILPKGFGEASQRMFHGTPPQVEIWIDPSRKAEAAMIEGLLFQKTMQGFGKRLTDRGAMRAGLRKSLDDVDAPNRPLLIAAIRDVLHSEDGRIRGDRLREQIRITILHELAHFHGLNEEELRELGYG